MGLFITLATPTAPMKKRSRQCWRDAPALAEDRAPLSRRDQFVKAELVAALRVRADRRAPVMGQELCAQADSQKRLASLGLAFS